MEQKFLIDTNVIIDLFGGKLPNKFQGFLNNKGDVQAFKKFMVEQQIKTLKEEISHYN